MTPSTGFNPLSEIMASAAAEPAPLSRRVGVTPPPRRPQQEVATPTRTVKRAESPRPVRPTPVRIEDPATAADDDDPYSAELKVGRNKPSGGRRPATKSSGERTRTTSTTLPLPLLDQLHRARLANEIAGGKFKIQQRLNDAILELPTNPEVVLAALQRYRNRLNFGVGTDEAGFIDEGRFTFRVTQTSERHMATIMSGLYDHLGRRVHRQDLFGLAMIRCISK